MNLFKLWRIEQNLRQADVEARTHIKRWKIAMLDRGMCVLTPAELKKIAKFTGIECDQLTASVSGKKAKVSNEE